MKLPPPQPEQYDMGRVLEQRVATQSHEGKDGQRQQGNSQDYHLGRHRQVEPHQLRVADQNEQDAGLHCVAGLQHPAQQLPGVGVVGGYGIDVAVLSVLTHDWLLVLPVQA